MFCLFKYYLIIFCFSLCIGCNQHKEKKYNSNYINKQLFQQKPGSSNNDTLFINTTAAVFFQPDSLQLIKIKAANAANVFSSLHHELFYQMRNARKVIRKYYLNVNIIESNQHRFICFSNSNKRTHIIDLNVIKDMSGLILFDQKQTPEIIDMMNIETALGFYFK